MVNIFNNRCQLERSIRLYILYVFIYLYLLLFIEHNWDVSPEQN